MKIVYFLLVFLLTAAFSPDAAAQISSRDAENTVSAVSLREDVCFLCDSLCRGRATGTEGAVHASMWISRRFRDLSLLPAGSSYFQSFHTNGVTAHNVLGILLADVRDLEASKDRPYVIVMSHYDHLGELDGDMYLGADSNASGVAALLGVARMLSVVRCSGRKADVNVLFVCLDAKQHSMAGSQQLFHEISNGGLSSPVSTRKITADQIKAVVNLDILGGVTSAPSSGRRDYLLMLGGSPWQTLLAYADKDFGTGLELLYDYYGSKNFTELFYERISDQRVFLENGFPSVLFTSGITLDTNRLSDTPDSLDYDVMLRRVRLVFHWLDRLLMNL